MGQSRGLAVFVVLQHVLALLFLVVGLLWLASWPGILG